MAVSEGTQEELERQRARWWATVSSGDLDGYLALFAEDAVWVTPELDEIAGREAIRAWLEPVFAQFDYELTITVADVRVAGSLGIERARFVSRMTPKPPAVGPRSGTTASVPSEPPVAEPERASIDADGPRAEDAPATALSGTDPGPSEPQIGDEAGPGWADDAPVEDTAEAPLDDDVTDGDGAGAAETPLGAALASDEADAAAVDGDEPEPVVEAPLVPARHDAGEDEPHEGRYLMYWRWHEDAGWLVHRYADVTGVG